MRYPLCHQTDSIAASCSQQPQQRRDLKEKKGNFCCVVWIQYQCLKIVIVRFREESSDPVTKLETFRELHDNG